MREGRRKGVKKNEDEFDEYGNEKVIGGFDMEIHEVEEEEKWKELKAGGREK